MKHLQRAIAFVYGFVLMYFVSIWFTGFVAARTISPEYFLFFRNLGSNGLETGHALLGVGLHLAPTLLLLLAGIVGAVHLCAPEKRRSTAEFVIAGAAVSYLFWMAFYASEFSLSAAFLPLHAAPWWAWPSIVAPLVALAVAGGVTLTRRKVRTGA